MITHLSFIKSAWKNNVHKSYILQEDGPEVCLASLSLSNQREWVTIYSVTELFWETSHGAVMTCWTLVYCALRQWCLSCSRWRKSHNCLDKRWDTLVLPVVKQKNTQSKNFCTTPDIFTHEIHFFCTLVKILANRRPVFCMSDICFCYLFL